MKYSQKKTNTQVGYKITENLYVFELKNYKKKFLV